MTFKNCVEYYPLDESWVGEYFDEPISKDENMFFWEDDSCVSFVVWDPQDKLFHSIHFGFFPVKGYINDTDDPNEFYPATYSDDFGWEKVDPFNEDIVFAPDDETAIMLGIPLEHYKEKRWRREIIAYFYDTEAYCNGWIFTSLESLNKFIEENFPKEE